MEQEVAKRFNFQTAQQAEWAAFNKNPTLEAAKKLTDPRNRETALRFFAPTAAQRAESAARQRAINSVTAAEADRHCQF